VRMEMLMMVLDGGVGGLFMMVMRRTTKMIR
jgi:hypothetical protein